MTDRDRLIEILQDALHEWECDVSIKTLTEITEHLIANDVIVPPYKVGSNVYCIFDNKVCIANVRAVYRDKIRTIVDLRVSFNDELPIEPYAFCRVYINSYCNNDIYLTREEAEKALKERENNAE